MCGVSAKSMETIIFVKTKAKIKVIELQSNSEILSSINSRLNGAGHHWLTCTPGTRRTPVNNVFSAEVLPVPSIYWPAPVPYVRK